MTSAVTSFPKTNEDWYGLGRQVGYTGAGDEYTFGSLQHRDCFRLGWQHGLEDFDKEHAEIPEK